MTVKKKRCNDCDRLRDVKFFSRNARAKDGLVGSCKDCAREISKAWREAHPKGSRLCSSCRKYLAKVLLDL